MTQSLVITGVDTGVGKTVVSALLAAQLLRCGYSVDYIKPVQTGISPVSDEPSDAESVVTAFQAWGVETTGRFLAETFYTFPEPAAPSVAAKAANAPPATLDAVNARLTGVGARADFRILEGAGGVLVPMNDDEFFSDWLAEWRFPTVLVTTPQLGRLNHTLMSVEALFNRGVPLFAIVINHIESVDEASMLAVKTFRSELERALSMSISLENVALDEQTTQGPRLSLLETAKVSLTEKNDCQALDNASFVRVFQSQYKEHFKNGKPI